MTMIDIIDNLINACGLSNSEKSLTASTETSCEYMLTGRSLDLPVAVKGNIRDTSYSDELMDTDNSSVVFKFNDIVINEQHAIVVVSFVNVGINTYKISLQVVNYINYDENGQQVLI